MVGGWCCLVSMRVCVVLFWFNCGELVSLVIGYVSLIVYVILVVMDWM